MSGEDIPYGGRILAVADVFDAITSKRHYRDKMPIQNVIDILISGKDKHFDGKLVDVFLKISASETLLQNSSYCQFYRHVTILHCFTDF